MMSRASSIRRGAQPEEVHLEQADLLDRLHRVLRDRAVRAPALLVHHAAVLRELKRHDVRQGPVGDDHRRRVDRRVAHGALDARARVDDLARPGGPRRTRGRSSSPGLEAVLERRRPAHDRVRDKLARRRPRRSRSPGPARRRAWPRAGTSVPKVMIWATESRPVFLGHVALSRGRGPFTREVDVDVRHRDALGVEEALEEQVVRQRVDVGDVQRVGDDRAGRRAAPQGPRCRCPWRT